MQVIEINGMKMEIDMRHATRLDTFKVGTPVKLLIKSAHSEPEVKSGVVVGFEPFESAPTILVAYLCSSYNGAGIKTAYINTKTKDKYEIVASIDDHLPFAKADILTKMDRKIATKQIEIEDLERQRKYFLDNFDCYFDNIEKQVL